MKTPAVSALTGASYRQLDHWTRQGYVSPSIGPSRGTGYCREWSTEDAVRVAVILQLVQVGMDPRMASEYTRLPRSHPGMLMSASSSKAAVTVLVDVGKIRDALADRRDLVA